MTSLLIWSKRDWSLKLGVKKGLKFFEYILYTINILKQKWGINSINVSNQSDNVQKFNTTQIILGKGEYISRKELSSLSELLLESYN